MVNGKKSVLVSGSNGFVGKHLRRYLKKKNINVMVGNDFANQTKPLDVTNMSEVLSIRQQLGAIVHLAAKTSISDSKTSPWDTFRTNLLGTLNLLEFARQRNIGKFLNISTYVYGQPHYLPIDEEHPVDPHSPYNASKLLAERICESYSLNFDMDIVTLRPFYVYGPRPRPNSFVYCILEQILRKNGNVVLSGKSTRRDFLFIDDFMNLIELVLSNFPKGYEVFNVGYGKSHLLSEVSHTMGKLLGRRVSITYDDQMRLGDITDMVADISKISKHFNWEPSTSLGEGLKSILKDYRQHF